MRIPVHEPHWHSSRPLDDASDTTGTPCGSHDLIECERGSRWRCEAEDLIRRAFAAKHGAAIRTFMPTLLALQGRGGRICSVAGFRSAAEETLFLERYLTAPIEQELARRVGRDVARADIVEIGNLAGCGCRAACRLALLLPSLLLARGKRWVVFTATDAVRQLLSRHEAPIVELAVARAHCVAGSGDDWGRYYDRDPRVLAGYLPDGLKLRRQATIS
jgi:hypothetical protein